MVGAAGLEPTTLCLEVGFQDTKESSCFQVLSFKADAACLLPTGNFVLSWGCRQLRFHLQFDSQEGNPAMIRTVEAVYEQGVLRPLTPVELSESQRVRLIIADVPGASQRDMAIVERARAEVGGLSTPPTIEEVRAALACIPGSFSDDVIAERGDF